MRKETESTEHIVNTTIEERGHVQPAAVVGHHRLCREHLRLTICVENWPSTYPGQFVHVAPLAGQPKPYRVRRGAAPNSDPVPRVHLPPMLRRAFSIAGFRRDGEGAEFDLIYRIVGTATRWMESLRVGERVSIMGPLGNRFPIHPGKSKAWLVSGGVGLPPMLWLAQTLRDANKQATAFCGARTADLLPLTLDPRRPPASDAHHARCSATEFANYGVPVIISTDDGSIGYHGHIGEALRRHDDFSGADVDDTVVYACGPERMMAFVADHCAKRGIECHVCVERAMACGTGMCQSCVVPVNDPTDVDGWRYRLCCTEGPVFDAGDILWEPPDQGRVS